MNKPKTHISVLLKESVDYLKIRPHSTHVDCTLGLGGHSNEILSRDETITVVGIDQDRENLEEAKRRLEHHGGRAHFYNRNFEEIAEIVKEEGLDHVDGILMDLGICSTHIDEPERGFSFMKEGPLDMRFDKSQELSAYEVIRTYSKDDLQQIFSQYGEEKEAKTVAEAIVAERRRNDIATTTQLDTLIEKVKRFKRPGRSAGTNVFQALRIEVNREFQVLETALEAAVHVLAPGGRLVIISYHSLEDRIIKKVIKKYEAKGKKDDEFKLVKWIEKTPILPSKEETEENPRSRSARMRVVERV